MWAFSRCTAALSNVSAPRRSTRLRSPQRCSSALELPSRPRCAGRRISRPPSTSSSLLTLQRPTPGRTNRPTTSAPA
eukprot:5129030-Pyramimonas_sp.AAC.1